MQFTVYIKQWQGATKIKGNFRFRSNVKEPLQLDYSFFAYFENYFERKTSNSQFALVFAIDRGLNMVNLTNPYETVNVYNETNFVEKSLNPIIS